MKQYLGAKIVGGEQCIQNGKDGYKVVYEDGYTSWSPTKAFEEAYRRIDGLTFGLAVEALKKGYIVQRKGWNGKNMWLQLQVPDSHSKMTLPYIYMCTVQGDFIPWLASQADMLAEDWCIVENPLDD